jgi:hypothetical protein
VPGANTGDGPLVSVDAMVDVIVDMLLAIQG